MDTSAEPNAASDSSSAKTWAVFLGTTVAVATATALVAWRIRRGRMSAPRLADVPDIISECFDRVRQIEGELRRLRPGTAESAH